MSKQSDCLFCKIARKEINAYEIYRDKAMVAFLDIAPIRPGHVQIIPLEHYAYFDDLPTDLAASMMQLGQRIAKVQKQICYVDRVALLFTGGDIPHAHAHLVPMHEKTDITSRRYIAEENITFCSTPRASGEELSAMAERLAQALGQKGVFLPNQV
ncbi:HIT-like protein [Pseudovibrio axinellae]|uniref:HIT-like protein n=1 Tax=Pseudovibrio axinellae TaxID=989403 RepID=A0A165XRI4_9HYPH|nr:HIT family protein [Pseudovibrio axinellae]KZL17971.1 HIT-like protein [Pseudovibrio axinellae]SER14901.1 histidine triad (HIT) family protein [Pseudovibrio axinellae]